MVLIHAQTTDTVINESYNTKNIKLLYIFSGIWQRVCLYQQESHDYNRTSV